MEISAVEYSPSGNYGMFWGYAVLDIKAKTPRAGTDRKILTTRVAGCVGRPFQTILLGQDRCTEPTTANR